MNKDLEINSFLSGESDSIDPVQAQRRLFMNNCPCHWMFNFLREAVFVTNKDKQIVFANDAMVRYSNRSQGSEIIGLKPGEAFHCIHTEESSSSCEGSSYCKTCGSMYSLISCRTGKKAAYDFSLSRYNGDQIEALDLEILAYPVKLETETFYFFSLTDVSHEKRRAALERIFFHDILNTAGGLFGISRMLKEDNDPNPELIDLLFDNSQVLLQEIEAQKTLAAAERNEILVDKTFANSLDIVRIPVKQYISRAIAENKNLVVEPFSESIQMVIDITLATRVLGNMIKNALEASRRGDKITLGCKADGDRVEFWVQNTGSISDEVRPYIFNRSFSTKGKGRGLGTYSMKLLSEKYLNGTVSFESKENQTVFRASFPRELQ
jgi:hypothetical protein